MKSYLLALLAGAVAGIEMGVHEDEGSDLDLGWPDENEEDYLVDVESNNVEGLASLVANTASSFAANPFGDSATKAPAAAPAAPANTPFGLSVPSAPSSAPAAPANAFATYSPYAPTSAP